MKAKDKGGNSRTKNRRRWKVWKEKQRTTGRQRERLNYREGGRERSGIKGNKGRKETGSRSSRGGCIFRRKDTKWVISAREKFVKA